MGRGMWERWGGEDTGNETHKEYTQSGNIRSGTHKEWNIESDTHTECNMKWDTYTRWETKEWEIAKD